MSGPPRGCRRYWRELPDNTIERMCVLEHEPDPDDTWTRGIGVSAELRAEVSAKTSKKFKGVPKTEQQRHLMRLAKLDKPKPESQKQRMRESHQAKIARAKLIQANNPSLTFREAYKLDTINQGKKNK